MPTAAHWYKRNWGKLTLGTNDLPGFWEVEGEAARKIDVKERKGEDGAVIKDQGYSNAEITLVGRIISEEDLNTLEGALKEIHPRRKGAARDPLVIDHPALGILGITSVYVVAIEAPKLGADDVLEVRIRCIEWCKPKDVAKKKQSTKGGDWKPTTERGRVLQARANASVTRGRELTLASGQTIVDLGLPPPRDSALSFLGGVR